MTNWNSPSLLITEGFALIKLVHVVAGLYIWEFVLHLDYEYSIITGKRKLSRTVPLYVVCRWSTLLAIIMQLVGIDYPAGVNCQALVVMAFVFAYFAFLSASCLIILRIHALWENKKIIIAVTVAIWLANTAAFVYNISISRAHREAGFCEVDHIANIRITILSSLITDVVLLSLMLIGVLRWKKASLTGCIWRVMYQQGLIWVIIVTLADVPPTVFILLNFNDPMDRMFMVPSMIILSIGALRIYRALVDSDALNTHTVPEPAFSTPRGLSTKSDIQFATPSQTESRPGGREDGKETRDGAADPNYLVSSPKRVLLVTNQDDESLESEPV